ncbi:MAG: Nodulin-21 [Parcubacteria group bacterium]|nr:Nodulin-21 [Parcubacteria group bacterium]
MTMNSHQGPESHTHSVAAKQNWLRASVLGANDGIVSLAALVVGIAGAAVSNHTLLLTGVAGILAGALSMAVGEYISVNSQRDTEHALLKKERFELDNYAASELDELTAIYEKKGLKPETARIVAEELSAHDVFAAHVDAELGIDPDNLTNPWHAAVASAASFFAGALIPFIAILVAPVAVRIPVTFVAVVVALIITGILSARASGVSPLVVTARSVIGGLIAMFVTFGIGRLLDVNLK